MRLHIEEDNRKSEGKIDKPTFVVKANLVESCPKKRKFVSNKPYTINARKAKKLKGNCFNCDKLGHMTKECRAPKKAKKIEANLTENRYIPLDKSELSLTAVVFEANYVDNPKEW